MARTSISLAGSRPGISSMMARSCSEIMAVVAVAESEGGGGGGQRRSMDRWIDAACGCNSTVVEDQRRMYPCRDISGDRTFLVISRHSSPFAERVL